MKANGFARAWQRAPRAHGERARGLVHQPRPPRVDARGRGPTVVTTEKGATDAIVAPSLPALPPGFPDLVRIAGPTGVRFASGPLALAVGLGSGVAFTAPEAQALDAFPISASMQDVDYAGPPPLSPAVAAGYLIGGVVLMAVAAVALLGLAASAGQVVRARKEAEVREAEDFERLWSLAQAHFRGSEGPYRVTNRGLVGLMRLQQGIDSDAAGPLSAEQLGDGENAQLHAMAERLLLSDPDHEQRLTGAQMEALARSVLHLPEAPDEATKPT
ncbi:MAG: hypothetical protein HY696_01905 [Deltaproteobacteria bacterium]|nr:hypothetical protein [Deltaproteobacteria bacterium]